MILWAAIYEYNKFNKLKVPYELMTDEERQMRLKNSFIFFRKLAYDNEKEEARLAVKKARTMGKEQIKHIAGLDESWMHHLFPTMWNHRKIGPDAVPKKDKDFY